MAKLNRRMNLVLEVAREDGSIAHVHSTPISRAIYEDNFELISSVMATMYSKNFTPAVGARIAMMEMKKIAREEDGNSKQRVNEEKLEALLNEMWRITSVLAIVDGSWQTFTMDQAIKQQMLSEDDLAEVQNSVCFFTAASWFHKPSELEEMIYPVLKSGGQITSLDSTEFKTSLPTSMPVENITAKLTTSSVPI